MFYIRRGFIGFIIGCLLELFIFNLGSLLLFFNIVFPYALRLGFSFSRVIAVILIFIVGSFLFNVQRMPDYHLERLIDDNYDKSDVF